MKDLTIKKQIEYTKDERSRFIYEWCIMDPTFLAKNSSPRFEQGRFVNIRFQFKYRNLVLDLRRRYNIITLRSIMNGKYTGTTTYIKPEITQSVFWQKYFFIRKEVFSPLHAIITNLEYKPVESSFKVNGASMHLHNVNTLITSFISQYMTDKKGNINVNKNYIPDRLDTLQSTLSKRHIQVNT